MVVLAGGMGTRISENTYLLPKPMIEIGERPILWHLLKLYSSHSINDFVICCGYEGYVIKEYFTNYFLHMFDVTFDISNSQMEVHQHKVEPWRVTLLDTVDDTLIGDRLKRVKKLCEGRASILFYIGRCFKRFGHFRAYSFSHTARQMGYRHCC